MTFSPIMTGNCVDPGCGTDWLVPEIIVGLPFSPELGTFVCVNANCAVLEIRLLSAGHPSQAARPPVPLQRPPPGHDPCVTWSAET